MLSKNRPDIDAHELRGKLFTTIGRYLPDLVFGANDGIITTLAVVSGVVGAALSPSVILILGFANLIADGFSMGASNVLSRRSDPQNGALPNLSTVANHGLATFLGFILAGVVPLLAYLLPFFEGERFAAATALALGTLFAVGASRAAFTGRGWLASGLEMLILGALAAAVAYGVGALAAMIIGQGALEPRLTGRASEVVIWLA
jgi:vacuolar iron transporter family protein